ncbi:hypothetical protein PPS11_03098 [Pseudomonas putida S11]|nr:hypothetical protein PPS11_03098 [Pseudomonas putida S11]
METLMPSFLAVAARLLQSVSVLMIRKSSQESWLTASPTSHFGPLAFVEIGETPAEDDFTKMLQVGGIDDTRRGVHQPSCNGERPILTVKMSMGANTVSNVSRRQADDLAERKQMGTLFELADRVLERSKGATYCLKKSCGDGAERIRRQKKARC